MDNKGRFNKKFSKENVVGTLTRFVIIFFAYILLVETLWNFVLVPVLGVKSIDIPQAAGIYVLCSLLFQDWKIQ